MMRGREGRTDRQREREGGRGQRERVGGRSYDEREGRMDRGKGRDGGDKGRWREGGREEVNSLNIHALGLTPKLMCISLGRRSG